MTAEMTDNELGVRCMNVLIEGVGPVEAERFISIVNREHFDYTEWQKNLFTGETVRSLGAKVMAFAAPNP